MAKSKTEVNFMEHLKPLLPAGGDASELEAAAQQEDHQQEHQEQHAASCGRVDHPGRDSLRYREHRLIRLVEGAD